MLYYRWGLRLLLFSFRMYCVKLLCGHVLKIKWEFEVITLSRTFTYLSICFSHTARMNTSLLPVLFFCLLLLRAFRCGDSFC